MPRFPHLYCADVHGASPLPGVLSLFPSPAVTRRADCGNRTLFLMKNFNTSDDVRLAAGRALWCGTGGPGPGGTGGPARSSAAAPCGGDSWPPRAAIQTVLRKTPAAASTTGSFRVLPGGRGGKRRQPRGVALTGDACARRPRPRPATSTAAREPGHSVWVATRPRFTCTRARGAGGGGASPSGACSAQ